jgi:hypothetical protein
MQLVAGPIADAGLEGERLARRPNLCLGDVRGSREYELDDAVLVRPLSASVSLSAHLCLSISIYLSLCLIYHDARTAHGATRRLPRSCS